MSFMSLRALPSFPNWP